VMNVMSDMGKCVECAECAALLEMSEVARVWGIVEAKNRRRGIVKGSSHEEKIAKRGIVSKCRMRQHLQ